MRQPVRLVVFAQRRVDSAFWRARGTVHQGPVGFADGAGGEGGLGGDQRGFGERDG